MISRQRRGPDAVATPARAGRRRRAWHVGRLAAAAALLAGAALAAGPAPASGGDISGDGADPAEADRPNLVVIMTDDQTMDDLSVMPNVRRLISAQGVTFRESFASYPLCCPSRATYLTGQLPHNHDVLDNKPPDGAYQKLREDETLPVWMSRAGYQTVHIGKYPNGYGLNPEHVPPGWSDWHGLTQAYRMWGYRINHNGAVKRYGKVHDEDPALYQTDVLRNLATDYIDAHAGGDTPFFLSWAPLAPHTELYPGRQHAPRNPRPAPRHLNAFADAPLPRTAAFNEADMSDKPEFMREWPLLTPEKIEYITKIHRSRMESLLAVDEAVAAIVERLEANHLLSNTVVIFTSDNGFLLGHHRVSQGKIHAYDPSARVPLMMRGPGVPKGATVDAMVSNVDVPATVLDYADATPAIAIDGLSLATIARDPATAAGRRLLLETGEKNARSVGDRWYAAVRTSRYLYVEHWLVNSDGEDVRAGRELYDQLLDPEQLESRHRDPAYAAIRGELTAALARLQHCAGSSCSGL